MWSSRQRWRLGLGCLPQVAVPSFVSMTAVSGQVLAWTRGNCRVAVEANAGGNKEDGAWCPH